MPRGLFIPSAVYEPRSIISSQLCLQWDHMLASKLSNNAEILTGSHMVTLAETAAGFSLIPRLISSERKSVSTRQSWISPVTWK